MRFGGGGGREAEAERGSGGRRRRQAAGGTSGARAAAAAQRSVPLRDASQPARALPATPSQPSALPNPILLQAHLLGALLSLFFSYSELSRQRQLLALSNELLQRHGCEDVGARPGALGTPANWYAMVTGAFEAVRAAIRSVARHRKPSTPLLPSLSHASLPLAVLAAAVVSMQAVAMLTLGAAAALALVPLSNGFRAAPVRRMPLVTSPALPLVPAAAAVPLVPAAAAARASSVAIILAGPTPLLAAMPLLAAAAPVSAAAALAAALAVPFLPPLAAAAAAVPLLARTIQPGRLVLVLLSVLLLLSLLQLSLLLLCLLLLLNLIKVWRDLPLRHRRLLLPLRRRQRRRGRQADAGAGATQSLLTLQPPVVPQLLLGHTLERRRLGLRRRRRQAGGPVRQAGGRACQAAGCCFQAGRALQVGGAALGSLVLLRKGLKVRGGSPAALRRHRHRHLHRLGLRRRHERCRGAARLACRRQAVFVVPQPSCRLVVAAAAAAAAAAWGVGLVGRHGWQERLEGGAAKAHGERAGRRTARLRGCECGRCRCRWFRCRRRRRGACRHSMHPRLLLLLLHRRLLRRLLLRLLRLLCRRSQASDRRRRLLCSAIHRPFRL